MKSLPHLPETQLIESVSDEGIDKPWLFSPFDLCRRGKNCRYVRIFPYCWLIRNTCQKDKAFVLLKVLIEVEIT